MNEMRRLEEIRDQCCRLRESAAADVAAERKVQWNEEHSVYVMSHASDCRRFVKIEPCCCVSSRKLHNQSLLVFDVSLSGRRA